MAPEDSVEVVLVRLDGRVAGLEQSIRRLEGSVQGLAYVDARLYQSEQAAQDRAMADLAATMRSIKADLDKRIDNTQIDLDKRIDNTEGSNRATLTLLIGAILTAIVGILVRMALG